MARRINFSKPLSEEDAQYVIDRPWLIQDARLNGDEVTFADDFTVDEADENPEGGENPDESPEGSDEGDGSEGDDDNEDEGDGDEVAPYSEWEYSDLKDEAGNRGLSKAGSKEQLIARIEENDAERAEAPEETGEDEAE